MQKPQFFHNEIPVNNENREVGGRGVGRTTCISQSQGFMKGHNHDIRVILNNKQKRICR